MCEISVIIPVYNVENYLNQCLDSICNQTFHDIEIICVNDGSTDGSLNILKDYGKSDERIRIISQDNNGLGAARNKGLSHAKGKYVYFIDSDDYLELEALEKLHNNILSNDSDVVLFKFQIVDDFKNIHKRGIEFRIDKVFGDIAYDDFIFTYKDAKRHVLNSAFSACLKLYKKEYIDSIHFEFPENLNFEDVLVHAIVMLNAPRISFVNEYLYNYRSNPDSILNSTANGFDIFKVIDSVEDYLRKNEYYDELENEFIYFKIAQILIYLKTEKSEDYFSKAKEEFEKIRIKDENTLPKKYLNEYKQVIESDSCNDYYSKIKVKNKNPPSQNPIKKLIISIKNFKF